MKSTISRGRGSTGGAAAWLLVLGGVMVLGACVTVPDNSPPRRVPIAPSTSAPPAPAEAASPSDLTVVTDPTVNHLHDLGGSLLLFYATNLQLPARLDQVEAIVGKPAQVNPATGKPFLYWAQPVKVEGQPGWLVVCQATGTRADSRWALFINDRDANGAMTTGVRLLSELVVRTALEQRSGVATPSGQ